MPIFEYKCQDCGTKFEKLVRRADQNDVNCPSCGQQHLSQEFSTFAAQVSAGPKSSGAPMCPSGGVCRTPGACGLN